MRFVKVKLVYQDLKPGPPRNVTSHMFPVNVLPHVVIIIELLSIEESPSWEGNSRFDGEELSNFSWTPKAHFLVHKILRLISVLSQTNQPHILTFCFFRIHFNIILPSTRKSPIYLFHSGFPTKTVWAFIIPWYECYIPQPNIMFSFTVQFCCRAGGVLLHAHICAKSKSPFTELSET
jgi:hypothetical protein